MENDKVKFTDLYIDGRHISTFSHYPEMKQNIPNTRAAILALEQTPVW